MSENQVAPPSARAACGVRTAIVDAPIAHAYAPVLAALHRQCFAEAWGDEAILALIEMPGAFAIVAIVADEPAGFALCRLVCDEGEVLALGVIPARRRRGVGAALLAAIVRHAGERSGLRLVLEVAADNVAARAFYTATGFVAVGRRRGYYVGPRQACVDALILARDHR